MPKTKKQILGLIGLAFVGLMTAFAYCLPAPSAAAESSSNIDVVVTVLPDNTSIEILSPADGDEVSDGEATVAVRYSDTKRLEFQLTYTDADGQVQTIDLPAYEPTDPNGEYEFALNLEQYGYGDFVLKTTAIGVGGTIHEDAVSFTHQAATVENAGTNEDGNPVITIDPSDEFDHGQVQVYDKDGNPVFVDDEGNEVPIVIDRDDIDPETGKITVELPMTDYDAPEGEYTGLVVTYDQNDDALGQYTFTFYYKPTPKLPNTGSVFANLNIARADYIITGLIFFGLVAGFAIYLIGRRSHRR